MPLQRSVVVKAEKELKEAVYKYLKENAEEVFSAEEIFEILREKKIISPEARRLWGVTTVRAALTNLCRKKKAEQHVYDGEVFYGVK